jgi:alcohol dehydrogenase class IV
VIEELSAVQLAFPDTPVRVYAAQGGLVYLPALLAALVVERPFLICGPQVRRLPQVMGLVEAGLFVGVYDQVEPDPSDATVARAGEAARQAGAEVLVAIGGGSSLDGAKAVAAEAAQPGWIAGRDQPGQPTEVPAGVLLVVAVPTTAGTGSEVTPFSVITFTATHRKLVLSHPSLLPRAALLDPTLLTSAPREARVAAGMDALTHAVESYLSRQSTEETRARSLEAVRGIAAHLPGAAADPPEVADLAGMQRAALVAGLAFSRTRLGVVHALALPLSALFGVPHGVANAILLPHGMAYNLPAARAELGNLARALLVQFSREDENFTPEQAAAAVQELAQRIGAPARMRDVGVERAAIPRMAEEAGRSPHLGVNPREVQAGDLVGIYEEAW